MATRVFAGTGGPNEVITQPGRWTAVGATVDTITYAALIRFGTVVDGGMLRAPNGSDAAVVQANNYLDHQVYWAQGGKFQSTAGLPDGYDAHLNEWMLLVFSRVGARMRVHRWLSATGWSHADGAGSDDLLDSTNGPIAAIYHGSISASQYGNYFLAADALAPVDLTDDATVEALGLETSIQAWADAFSSGAAWAWNQTIESTPVVDITAGGAFQASLSDRHGTAVAADSDDPPGFAFTLPSLFTSETPNTTNNSDGGAAGISLATTMVFLEPGFVTHIRFWATDTVGGTYVVELWQPTASDPGGATGTLLATKTAVTADLVPGWNEVELDTPVAVDTTHAYRPCVNNSQGRYVHRAGVFADTPLQTGTIIGIKINTDPVGLGALAAGVFAANSPAGTYPSDSGNACYYTDVVFATSVGPTPSVVDLTPAVATLSAVATSPVPGAVTVALTPATAVLVGIATSPAPGRVTVALSPATATLGAVALAPAPGRVTVAITPAVLVLTAVPTTANVLPGQYVAGAGPVPGWSAGGSSLPTWVAS